eukprot:m.49138 g.49138  ORF g.49138 m.49138 type:complete len:94 (-) comp15301_c0_seq6:643-924(-)
MCCHGSYPAGSLHLGSAQTYIAISCIMQVSISQPQHEAQNFEKITNWSLLHHALGVTLDMIPISECTPIFLHKFDNSDGVDLKIMTKKNRHCY